MEPGTPEGDNATSHSIETTATILRHPNADSPRVRQGTRRGQYPAGLVDLGQRRIARAARLHEESELPDQKRDCSTCDRLHKNVCQLPLTNTNCGTARPQWKAAVWWLRTEVGRQHALSFEQP